MKPVFKSSKSLYLIAVIFLILFISVPAYYFYDKSQKSQLENPQNVLERVSELIELPKEVPTIATVSEKERLKYQQIFTKAIEGDKVLIFKESKKAILFRPSLDKIVEVGQINLPTDSVAGESTASGEENKPKVAVSPKPVEFKLALFNGTKRAGLASKTESEIKKTFPGAVVTEKSNAENDYDKTVVVILNSLQKDIALKIASDLKVKTDSLPAGENKPKDADILILLGKDRF